MASNILSDAYGRYGVMYDPLLKQYLESIEAERRYHEERQRMQRKEIEQQFASLQKPDPSSNPVLLLTGEDE